MRDLWTTYTLAYKGVENSDQFLHRHLPWPSMTKVSFRQNRQINSVELFRQELIYIYICTYVQKCMIPPKKACDHACTCKECVYRLCISNSPFLQIMFTFLHCRLICFCRSGSKTARQIFAPNQILQTMTQKCHSVIFRDSIRNYLCDRES